MWSQEPDKPVHVVSGIGQTRARGLRSRANPRIWSQEPDKFVNVVSETGKKSVHVAPEAGQISTSGPGLCATLLFAFFVIPASQEAIAGFICACARSAGTTTL